MYYSDGQGGPSEYQRRVLEDLFVTARAVRPMQTDVRPGPVGCAPEKLQRIDDDEQTKRLLLTEREKNKQTIRNEKKPRDKL